MKKLLLSVLFLAAGSSYAQWTQQNTMLPGGSRGVSEIEIVDANTVWALAYDGSGAAANLQEFTKTTNGGTTWTSGTIDVGDPTMQITNLRAISATTAWTGVVHPVDGFGGVFKTSDGGVTWENQNPAGYVTSGTLSSFFNVVHFFNSTVGLTEGDPIGTGNGEFEVYRTIDGGTTWTAVPAAALPNPLSGEYGYNGGNVAAGNSFWFVTNKGKLYRTTDFGVSWTKLDTPLTDFSGTTVGGNLHFSDNNNGIILKRNGAVATATYTLYKTANGGTTWDTGTPYTSGYNVVSYIPGTTTLVGTQSAAAASGYSVDNGTTWTPIDTGVQRTSIAFLNGTTGWAGGFTDAASELGGIFKYTGVSLGLEDVVSNNIKFKVYPNPANNELNLSGASINEVAVYDLLGKQVLNQKFAAQDQATLNVSSLQTGMYVLTATNENGAKETVKFAKQ